MTMPCSGGEWVKVDFDGINPQSDDTLTPLGDYVDRGIDSKGVLDQLIELQDRCNLVPILGNHDQMMLHAKDGRSDFQFWLNCGGDAALDSYGSSGKLELIPRSHIRLCLIHLNPLSGTNPKCRRILRYFIGTVPIPVTP